MSERSNLWVYNPESRILHRIDCGLLKEPAKRGRITALEARGYERVPRQVVVSLWEALDISGRLTGADFHTTGRVGFCLRCVAVEPPANTLKRAAVAAP